MLNPTRFQNSRPDGSCVLEVVDGPVRFVPLTSTTLRGEVAGPLADLQLSQVFSYSAAQCAQVLEAIYRFPLPGDAAVTGVRVRFGEVEIQASLQAREDAEADYQAAQDQGRQAALLSRTAPNVFSLRLSGLTPDQPIAVETSYAQLARTEEKGWSLRLPLTTSPRYVRGDEAGTASAQGQPLLLLRDPSHHFELDLLLRGTSGAMSATHALKLTTEGDGLRVQLADGAVRPDRDFVICWQPAQDQDRPTLRAWSHEDAASGHLYFLASVTPPARPSAAPPSREVLVLVDHSGSMEGAKWDAADWAVTQFLSGLTERDSFNLCLFHSSTRWFAGRPRQASREAVARAIDFLAHTDSGGTELGVALEQSLQQDRGSADTRHVLVITDAEVSDAARILHLVDREWSRDDHRRISVLCIDAAPNAYLASEMAERGGGVSRFLTSDPREEDITTALDEVLADWSQPALTGLHLTVNRPRLQISGRQITGQAVDLGDLPAGRALWIAGRTALQGAGDPIFTLTAAGATPAVCRTSPGSAALRPLFGARLVLALEQLIEGGLPNAGLEDRLRRLGFDPEAVLRPGERGTPIYAENARAAHAEALRALLTREALAFGLASSQTSFVATRREAGKQVEITVPVANALPHGWSDSFAAAGPARHLARPLSAPAAFGAAMPPPSPAQPRACGVGASGRSNSPADNASVLFEAQSDLSGPQFAMPAAAQSFPVGGSGAAEARSSIVAFAGVAIVTGSELLLFDTDRAADRAPFSADACTLSRLELRFPGGAPDPNTIDARLLVLLYVDDLSTPRASVKIRDLARNGGRPLNIAVPAGARVRLLIADPNGAWASQAPLISVTLQRD